MVGYVIRRRRLPVSVHRADVRHDQRDRDLHSGDCKNRTPIGESDNTVQCQATDLVGELDVIKLSFHYIGIKRKCSNESM